MMDDTTVQTPAPRRAPRGFVDLLLGLVGTAAAVVAFTAEPLTITVPAVIVMAVTGTVMVRRNSGDDQ